MRGGAAPVLDQKQVRQPWFSLLSNLLIPKYNFPTLQWLPCYSRAQIILDESRGGCMRSSIYTTSHDINVHNTAADTGPAMPCHKNTE